MLRNNEKNANLHEGALALRAVLLFYDDAASPVSYSESLVKFTLSLCRKAALISSSAKNEENSA